MKSYKDIDKDIILNAPEGAMWVVCINKDNVIYYKHENSKMYKFYTGEDTSWDSCYDHKLNDWMLDKCMIPLPNIEIPWEATEDSKCPVPYGTKVYIKWADHECEDNNPGIWNWRTFDLPIISYKIIDEEYLPSVATVTITEDSATIEPGVKVTVWQTVEDKLIKRLEFLQNLANKFPEIRDEAIKFMSCELDGYMNTLWENEESE